MSSTRERATWLERHREVVREIRPDQADAHAKLQLAERNLERARSHAEGDPDLALVAAESALVNLADAVLAAEGFREHSALIAAARKSRNTALYDTAGSVVPSFVIDVTRVVSVLLKQVRDR